MALAPRTARRGLSHHSNHRQICQGSGGGERGVSQGWCARQLTCPCTLPALERGDNPATDCDSEGTVPCETERSQSSSASSPQAMPSRHGEPRPGGCKRVTGVTTAQVSSLHRAKAPKGGKLETRGERSTRSSQEVKRALKLLCLHDHHHSFPIPDSELHKGQNSHRPRPFILQAATL